jgi:hypothetical protein
MSIIVQVTLQDIPAKNYLAIRISKDDYKSEVIQLRLETLHLSKVKFLNLFIFIF